MKLKCQHCNLTLDLEPAAEEDIKPFDCPGCGSLNEEPFQIVAPALPPPLPRLPEPQKPAFKPKMLPVAVAGLALALSVGAVVYYRHIQRQAKVQRLNQLKDQNFYDQVELYLLESQQQLEQIKRKHESGALTTEKANQLKAKVLKDMEEVRALRDQYKTAPRSVPPR